MDHEIAIGYVQTSAELSKTSCWSDDVYAYELSRLGPIGLDGLLLWGSDLICIHILLNLGIWNQILGHRCPLASLHIALCPPESALVSAFVGLYSKAWS